MKCTSENGTLGMAQAQIVIKGVFFILRVSLYEIFSLDRFKIGRDSLGKVLGSFTVAATSILAPVNQE